VISERKKSGIIRHDLIDTLIELEKDENLTKDQLIAQAAQFLAAGKFDFLSKMTVMILQQKLCKLNYFLKNFIYEGYETSSATQSFALYEIAKNAEIQDRLRDEIKEMLNRTDGKNKLRFSHEYQ
jgi:cytochrome P450 family 6